MSMDNAIETIIDLLRKIEENTRPQTVTVNHTEVKLGCTCIIQGIADLACPVHGVNGSAPFSDGQM